MERLDGFCDVPHRRFNPLRGEWLLVSPHRGKRPWNGDVSKEDSEVKPAYDPKCYLCPGNARAGGEIVNPKYESTFVFKNDFSALFDDGTPQTSVEFADGLFRVQGVKGECRVICFSPRHDLTLPKMSVEEIRGVVDLWASQTEELSQKYRWVQIFENKGQEMGCSSPHPHGQIWASSSLPNEALKEDENQKEFFKKHGRTLLSTYVEEECRQETRIVTQNEDWLVLVPFWAVWPYETLLLPKFDVQRISELSTTQRDTLAQILKEFLGTYDSLFDVSFPYSMGWHGAPGNAADGVDNAHWTLHAHFYPPLFRSAKVKKHMVGYEMLGEPQRDITPEQAADRLRALALALK
ncbi:MAG: UDP-glucose--hexose-1-phosphate uridylyltransferase [Planctomycetia bacterium]|nr:UDP-glucose--hexose-1-phosphate uridylyltransferase [Planctomycetia bacterium]